MVFTSCNLADTAYPSLASTGMAISSSCAAARQYSMFLWNSDATMSASHSAKSGNGKLCQQPWGHQKGGPPPMKNYKRRRDHRAKRTGLSTGLITLMACIMTSLKVATPNEQRNSKCKLLSPKKVRSDGYKVVPYRQALDSLMYHTP